MRTYRLSEFVAHGGAVNCVRIGRGTAGVLATGGDDKKVNLWRTGQTEVVKSLCGLQSSVECVVFGEKEDTVAAGGANGTVKIWDMDSGKVSRSLIGHRSGCLSLALTTSDPNYMVSGSEDCNVKVWDLRRREAITTFKNHKQPVVKVAISPDNKWVCSGSRDGEIKLWDIDSGRMIKDGWRHGASVTGLEFNQVEFLMVSSGADRTVRVWDLEVFEEVECLGPEATAVQGIAYAHDGSVLLTATADALKVWGLEPSVHHDTVPIEWRNLADLHLYYKDGQPRALGCCRSGSTVGVFMVDLRKVAPFCRDPSQAVAVGAGGAQHGGSSSSARTRGAQVVQEYQGALQLTQQQQQQQQPSLRSDAGVDRDKGAPAAFLSLLCEAAVASSAPEPEAGPLTRQLPRTRTPPRAAAPAGITHSSSTSSRQPGSAIAQQSQQPAPARRAAQPLPVQLSPRQHRARQQQSQQHQQQDTKGSDFFPEVEIRVPSGRTPPPAAVEQPMPAAMQPASRGQQRGQSTAGPGPAAAANSRLQQGPELNPDTVSQLASNLAAASLLEPQRQQPQREASRSRSNSSSRQKEAPGAGPISATLAAWLHDLPEAAAPEAASSAAHSKASSRSSSMPASRVPSRHNMGGSSLQQQQQQQPAAPDGPADPILAAMAGRPGLRIELARMAAALQVAKGFATRGNLEGAYKSVLHQGDPALACMMLEAVSARADAFELNSLEPLIKLLELLLGSGQEQQVAMGLSVLGLVLRGPGQTVHEVCSAPQPTGVDLSFEARRSRCMLLKMALEGLGLKVGVLSRSQGPTGTRAQMLAEELKRVVSVA